MDSSISVETLRNNGEDWNNQRKLLGIEKPNFREVSFIEEFHGKGFYDLPEFYDLDFSDSDMNMVSLRNCTFVNCCFDRARITFADLVDSHFQSCSFRNACMRVTSIGSATFDSCLFEGSDLSYCSAEKTSFKGSKLINTRMEHMSLVSNDFSDTIIEGCFVYGISTWDMSLENAVQRELIISKDNESCITVDDIELAQFLYLLINNNKLRSVIETITSKVVLILGNFSPKRKIVLNAIRTELRRYNLIPVMFDFSAPKTRNLTETVLTLASMSKVVVADLTAQRSIPHELASIIPHHPSVVVFPIILEGEYPYGMFNDYQSYPWVRPLVQYRENRINELVARIVDSI